VVDLATAAKCEPGIVQRAALLVPTSGAERLTSAGNAERLRCASLLKPLLFWAAGQLEPFSAHTERWAQLAREGVVVSANDPTVEAWRLCGGERLLGWLSERTGIRLPLEPGGERSFGRILVTASDVARAYAALARADDEHAARVLDWMCQVPAHQTFGVRDPLVERLSVPPTRVAVKCGWFLDADERRIRTHVAAIAQIPSGQVLTVVLSALPVDEPTRGTYAARYQSGEEVLPIHEVLAGCTLRAATRQALSDLGV
jgi:hypothetical protein